MTGWISRARIERPRVFCHPDAPVGDNAPGHIYAIEMYMSVMSCAFGVVRASFR